MVFFSGAGATIPMAGINCAQLPQQPLSMLFWVHTQPSPMALEVRAAGHRNNAATGQQQILPGKPMNLNSISIIFSMRFLDAVLTWPSGLGPLTGTAEVTSSLSHYRSLIPAGGRPLPSEHLFFSKQNSLKLSSRWQ